MKMQAWSLQFYSKETQVKMLFCKFSQVFQNRVLEEHLSTAACGLAFSETASILFDNEFNSIMESRLR